MHPLLPDLSGLTDDELQKRHTELQKKLMQAYRFGPHDAVPQLQMFIEGYQSEVGRRHQKLMDEMAKKASESGKSFNGIIDIS